MRSNLISAQYFLNKNIFVHLQQQIMELTSVLTNKLDFLEISRKDVSSLKILFIEMEVRSCNKNHVLIDDSFLIWKTLIKLTKGTHYVFSSP